MRSKYFKKKKGEIYGQGGVKENIYIIIKRKLEKLERKERNANPNCQIYMKIWREKKGLKKLN